MTDRNSQPVTDEAERWTVLRQMEEWLEMPMIILSFVWFGIVLAELVWGRSGLLELFGTAIWIIFIADFTLRLAIAPRKMIFLRNNIISIAALAIPALRMFRTLQLFRLARAARGFQLIRILGTANRSMNALKNSLSRRGLGYVLMITVLVAFLGAAGMLTFESAQEIEGGFGSYPEALWWTAMLLTTMGSGFWPLTAEGRILALLLSIYGFAVFGYITASFAAFFIGEEAQAADSEIPGTQELRALAQEIAALRAALPPSTGQGSEVE
ncbi:MAG: ion transporter [Alphaproteobacteria bacterium]